MGWFSHLAPTSRTSAPILPALDGPLRPNRGLDEAECILRAEQLDNVVTRGDEQLYSSGAVIRSLDGQQVATMPAPISAMASSRDGLLAVGLQTGGVFVLDGAGAPRPIGGTEHLNCPTALAFLDERTVVVANGSARHGPRGWREDLMGNSPSGFVAICRLDGGGVDRVLDGLAWPAGLAVAPDGDLLVSESARSRVLKVPVARPASFYPAWEDIPAYPGRIAMSEQGEYWVACPTIRNQLVEAVLCDRRFCARMTSELDQADWMAPTLLPRGQGAAPLQVNALSHEGIVRPWAASLSCGLVVRCDAEMRPCGSFHSRADGRRHGIGSIAFAGKDVLVTACGTGELLRLRLDRQ